MIGNGYDRVVLLSNRIQSIEIQKVFGMTRNSSDPLGLIPIRNFAMDDKISNSTN